MERVLISMDKNLLDQIDQEVNKLGHGASRSGYITEAMLYYLKLRRGFKFKGATRETKDD